MAIGTAKISNRNLRILDVTLITISITCGIIGGLQAMRAALEPMAGMRHMDGDIPQPIPAMPLHHMPEMFVGFAALLGLVVISPKLAPRTPKVAGALVSRPILKIAALTAALSIDVSKTSTLGFVLPGMQDEYGLSNVVASSLSVAGLAGTATGAIIARFAASRIEEQRIYLLSAIGFMMTSCCAMMPTFFGNIVMCFLMGVSVGALAPIVVAAVRDIGKESRMGGGLVILSSSIATAAGFLIAAGTSAWLEPTYSWRVMWLIGIPTGIALIPLSFIIRSDRTPVSYTAPEVDTLRETATSVICTPPQPTRRAMQFVFAFVTGLTGFSLTVWTPTLVKATGAPNVQILLLTVATALLAASVGLAVIQVFLGPRAVLGITAGVTGAALLTLATSAVLDLAGTVSGVALLLALFGSNAMASIVLPTAAQSSDTDSRAQFTAEVSAANRIGGLFGPPVLATFVVSTQATYAAIAVAGGVCCLLTIIAGSRYSQY